MYLQHTIVPNGLANTAVDGAAVGLSVQVRIGFPRGVPLSLVEGFELDIDSPTAAGHFGRDDIIFRLRGRSYRPADVVDVIDQRWEMGEIATLHVISAGGLAPGPHQITVTQYLRVRPTPEPAVTVGTRTVEIPPPPLISTSGTATNQSRHAR